MPDESPSHTVVTLSFDPAEAALLCAAAGVSVVSIEARDGGGSVIACATGAGADELRLRFADNILTEPAS